MNMFVARHAKKELNTSRRGRRTGYGRGKKGSAGEGGCNRVGKLEARLGAGQSGVADMEPNIGSTDFAW